MDFPVSFYIALTLLLVFGVELFLRRCEAWALPVATVYATVFGWYFVDFLGYRERYEVMPDLFIAQGFWQIAIFLVCFRILAPSISRRMTRGVLEKTAVSPGALPYAKLLVCALAIWAILFAIGLAMMEWDILKALFPIEARAGLKMWDRTAAEAGSGGFLIATANYVYLLVCSFFGILFILDRRPAPRGVCIGMMLLTWPYFLLSGSRNQFLAVTMPTIFAYTLFSKHRLFLKGIILMACFLALSSAFHIVEKYRNVGYQEWLSDLDEGTAEEKSHGGLNMFEELCFINGYLYSGMPPTLGKDYVVNALNFVPRAVWRGKPMISREYSMWRGYEGGESDIGLVATVSTGLIGQGILEFGPFFGAFAPAILMAIWAALLTRWWYQRASPLRLILFLVALGVTFNLGRDITLLTLWPVVFGYVIVRIAEGLSQPPQVVPDTSLAGARSSQALIPTSSI
jgi:oligosaccharide repeat unit polymerase